MLGIEIWGKDWMETVKRVDFALLPLSSFEYHGPMAPVGTDAAIANAFSDYIQKTYNCIAYPMITYTACPYKTQGQPTISIDPSTMLKYLIDVLQGIYDAGFSRVLILNAHDGNMGIGRSAAEAMGGNVHTLLVNWWELLSQDETQEFFPDGGRGHGGPYELSCAWAALDQNAEGDPQYDIPAFKLPGKNVHVESAPKGFIRYAGQISCASIDIGKKIMNKAYQALDEVIQNWIQYTA